jgi:hypothetical protein
MPLRKKLLALSATKISGPKYLRPKRPITRYRKVIKDIMYFYPTNIHSQHASQHKQHYASYISITPRSLSFDIFFANV